MYDTITNNYLPAAGGSGNWWGYHPTYDETDIVGVQFTAGITGSISMLETSMYTNDAPNNAALGVYADNGGAIGSLIETLPIEINAHPQLYASASYSGGETLLAGNSYWLVTPKSSQFNLWDDLTSSNGQTSNWFYTATTGTVGSLTSSIYTPIYYTNSVALHGLRITMSPSAVPEPQVYALVLAGLLVFAAGLRRRIQ